MYVSEKQFLLLCLNNRVNMLDDWFIDLYKNKIKNQSDYKIYIDRLTWGFVNWTVFDEK